MNKSDLIKVIAVAAGCSMEAAGDAADAISAEITISLRAGDDVRIDDVCTLYSYTRKETKRRHPGTGVMINVPAYVDIGVRDSGALHRALNG